MSGPLSGVKVIELAGIGPSPYACMLLADAGADVLRIERPSPGAKAGDPWWDLLTRSRPSVGIDLKHDAGRALVLDLAEQADVLIEGFRPGVAERLGLGPEECGARNQRLVYGRMTGWGQDGPLAEVAGHDIDYISMAGALWSIGRAGERPVPPLNLVGDFGGGGMLLAFGVVAAVLAARTSGLGQVVDAAMVDGAASLMTMFFAFDALGTLNHERGTNMLDTGAHFYEVYETADGAYLGVGAIERKFYEQLVELMGLERAELPDQMDQAHWPEMKERFAAVFATRTRDEWMAVFEGSDACVAPVLTMHEAKDHPHNRARGTFVEPGGVLQPAPAPRFSRTPGAITRPPSPPGSNTDEGLAGWGLSEDAIEALRDAGALGETP